MVEFVRVAGKADLDALNTQGSGDTTQGGANTTRAKRGQRGGGRKPVDTKTRARVRKLARSGMSRNAIARETGVSTASVTKICNEARPPITFDRTKTKVATEARMTDLKALRATEAEKSIALAVEFRDRMFTPRTVRTTDGNGGVVEYELDPGARDWKDTMTAYGIALDKHLVLVRHDSDDRDLPAVDKWLAAMLGE